MSVRDEVVALRKEGLTYLQIARQLNITVGTVAGHMSRHRSGAGIAHRVEVTKEQVDAEFKAGARNISHVAKRLGVYRAAVAKHVTKRPRGRSRNSATDEATHHVVQLINASPLSDIEIADLSGVSEHTISNWRFGHRAGKPEFLAWVKEALRR